jgi:hypothetical protein
VEVNAGWPEVKLAAFGDHNGVWVTGDQEITSPVFGRGRSTTLLVAVYLIIGAFVAANHHYFSHADGARGIASAVLAILLWPLVLAGVSLRIR